MKIDSIDHVIDLVFNDIDFIIEHTSDVNPIDYDELYKILDVYFSLLNLRFRVLVHENQN